MRLAVTGGAGFIGSHLCAALAARGDDVVVFDSCSGDAHAGAPPGVVPAGVQLVRADPRRAAADFHSAARDADAVVHLAALTGTGQSMYEVTRYTDANVALTAWLGQLLVDGVIRPGRVIFASSRAVYGEGPGWCSLHGRVALQPRRLADLAAARWEPRCPVCSGPAPALPLEETDAAHPRSIYGAGKLAAEHVLALAGEAAGVPVTRLRLFNVYGPGQPPTNPYVGVLATFLQAALHREELEVYEDGRIVRDLLFVGDCVGAFLAALDRPLGFDGVLNVGSAQPTELKAMAEVAAELVRPAVVPVRVSGRYRLGDPRAVVADASAAARELGWRARTPLRAGVEATFEWLRELRLPSQLSALSEALRHLEQRALLAEAAG